MENVAAGKPDDPLGTTLSDVGQHRNSEWAKLGWLPILTRWRKRFPRAQVRHTYRMLGAFFQFRSSMQCLPHRYALLWRTHHEELVRAKP